MLSFACAAPGHGAWRVELLSNIKLVLETRDRKSPLDSLWLQNSPDPHLSLAGAATKLCRDKHKYLSLQKLFFCDKKYFVIAINFVATKIESDSLLLETFVAVSILLSRLKTCFVATNTCLSRQKLYLWHLPPMTALTLSVATSNCSIGRTILQTFLCLIMKMLVYII